MIELKGDNLILSASILFEFVTLMDKAVSNKGVIYFSAGNGKLVIHTTDQTYNTLVYFERGFESDGRVSFGIDSDTFISFVKKIHDQPVHINAKSSNITLKQGNMNAKFPVVAVKKTATVPDCEAFEGEHKDWVVKGLLGALNAIPETSSAITSSKMAGILLETKNSISRMSKFSQVSLFTDTTNAFLKDSRILFSDYMAKSLKGVDSFVQKILVSRSSAGFQLTQGTIALFSMPSDSYPTDFDESLCFGEPLSRIRPYTFNTKSLSSASDMISNSLGSFDSWIHFSVVGRSGDNLVWQLTGKTFKGAEFNERVASTDGDTVESFSVNKTRLIKSLTLFGDSVNLHDYSRSLIALSDPTFSKVVYLTKVLI